MTIMNIKSEDATSTDYKHTFLINDSFFLLNRANTSKINNAKKYNSLLGSPSHHCQKSISWNANSNHLEQIIYKKPLAAVGYLEIPFFIRNMESMWAIKQKHMYIINSSTCSITVYFGMENFVQPLDGNTIKHFL